MLLTDCFLRNSSLLLFQDYIFRNIRSTWVVPNNIGHDSGTTVKCKDIDTQILSILEIQKEGCGGWLHPVQCVIMEPASINVTSMQIATAWEKFIFYPVTVYALYILEGNPSYGLCHALLASPRLFGWSGIRLNFSNYFGSLPTPLKRTYAKIINRFPAITFKEIWAWFCHSSLVFRGNSLVS